MGIDERKLAMPPIMNTGVSPKVSTIGYVRRLVMFPEYCAMAQILFATPRFSLTEFLTTNRDSRILPAPKLIPENNKIEAIDR